MLSMGRTTPKMSLPLGDMHPHLMHDSLVPPDSAPNVILIDSAVFVYTTVETVLQCFSMGRTSPKSNPSPWDMHPDLIHDFGAHPTQPPNVILIDSAVFVYTTVETVLQCFSVGVQPPKLSLAFGDMHPHLMHDSLGPPDSAPKRHLDRFSRFRKAHEREL